MSKSRQLAGYSLIGFFVMIILSFFLWIFDIAYWEFSIIFTIILFAFYFVFKVTADYEEEKKQKKK
jgi:Ca2+/Na+ antiporter